MSDCDAMSLIEFLENFNRFLCIYDIESLVNLFNFIKQVHIFKNQEVFFISPFLFFLKIKNLDIQHLLPYYLFHFVHLISPISVTFLPCFLKDNIFW